MAVISIKNKTKSGSLLVGNAAYMPPSFDSIATVTVGSGGASSVTFSSIPQTYSHLQLRIIGRTNRGSSLDNIIINFNGDTGANYYSRRLEGDGSGAYSDGYGLSNQPAGFLVPTSADAANAFTGGVMDILDYTSTVKNKTTRALRGIDLNGSGYMTLGSVLWMPTTPVAITSINLLSQNGANISQHSSFALYGIKE